MKSFKKLKLMTVWVLSSNMHLHLDIASGAMRTANIAPLDFAWLTFQIMLLHHPIFVVIIINPLMAAFIADNSLVAFSFK